MLSKTDIETIKTYGYCFDHEWRYLSLICGEPFLIDNCLCFYDGLVLTIVGFPLDARKFDLASLNQILDLNELFKDARYVIYFASSAIQPSETLNGFQTNLLCPGDYLSCDFTIDLKKFDLTSLHKNIRREIRAVEKAGVTMHVKRSPILGIQHINLIETFHATHEVDLLNVACFSRFQSYALLDETTLIELWKGSELCGMVLLSHFIPSRCIGLFSFTNHLVKNIASYMYLKEIETAQAMGAQYLHLGPATNQLGIYQYKAKWGAQAATSPCHYYMFHKNNIPHPGNDVILYSWADRLFHRERVKAFGI